MKLYGAAMPAPNPRRVRMFLAEKGVELPEIRIDLRAREHKSPQVLARNSAGQVPYLELDDGEVIAETVSICRYFEELHPSPPLFGKTPLERAKVDMWVRRIEFQLGRPIAMFWVHAHPLTAGPHQHKDFGESNRPHTEAAMRWLDRELEGRDYIAGDDFTVADIVALSTIDFAAFIGLGLPDDCARLSAWHGRVSARPSAAA
jgi:glutathione S-transferase